MIQALPNKLHSEIPLLSFLYCHPELCVVILNEVKDLQFQVFDGLNYRSFATLRMTTWGGALRMTTGVCSYR